MSTYEVWSVADNRNTDEPLFMQQMVPKMIWFEYNCVQIWTDWLIDNSTHTHTHSVQLYVIVNTETVIMEKCVYLDDNIFGGKLRISNLHKKGCVCI